MIYEILVKTQYALLFQVASETASMEQVVMTPFDYTVTGPSATGDFYSMFIDALINGHIHCCFRRIFPKCICAASLKTLFFEET